jgi:hypothetical protein
MPTYDLKKISDTMFVATRADAAAVFNLTHRIHHGLLQWVLEFDGKFHVDHDKSKTYLVNRLQAGAYDDHLITSVTIGDRQYPVVSRSELYDAKSDTERLAPLNTVHWWVKGTDDAPYFKCSLHTDEVSLETGGDTLMEALNSLRSELLWFDL